MCGAVSALEEDGDVPGDTGGDKGLIAGGDEDSGGHWLSLASLAHNSPDSSLIDPWEERVEPVLTDWSQAQPGLQSLADERERTGLLDPLLTGLHLLAEFLHQLFEKIILRPQVLTVTVRPHPAGAHSGAARSLERFPQTFRTKSGSVQY